MSSGIQCFLWLYLLTHALKSNIFSSIICWLEGPCDDEKCVSENFSRQNQTKNWQRNGPLSFRCHKKCILLDTFFHTWWFLFDIKQHDKQCINTIALIIFYIYHSQAMFEKLCGKAMIQKKSLENILLYEYLYIPMMPAFCTYILTQLSPLASFPAKQSTGLKFE